MLRFTCLLAFIGCALAGTIELDLDNKVPQLDGKIVGGVPTTVQKHPYQVSLQKSGRHICGGSLYKTNIVVTAAHCLYGQKPGTLSVRLGSTNHASGGIVIGVASFRYNVDYIPRTTDNDIGLVFLSHHATLSNTIKTIPLATSSPASGVTAVVTGWGTTREGSGLLPSTLQELEVKIVSREECASSYNYNTYEITKNMICGYNVGKDSCQGDSGGPLVADAKLVGIVSWGYGCARVGYPGVYTNVPSQHNWVLSHS